MHDWRQFVRDRLAGLKLSPAREAEIVEELAQHLADTYTEALASGAGEADALRVALAELEHGDLARELLRSERPAPEPIPLGSGGKGSLMSDFGQDLRFGLRMLAKKPGFTLVAVLTLALGIGANTAIFSVVNGVLLRPLPYPQSEQLVVFWEKQPDLDFAPFPAPDFLDYQSQSKSFESVAALRQLNFHLTGRGEAERIRGGVVSVNLFDLLRVQPMLGRSFRPEEGQAGAPRVALLNYGFWQRRFGGDKNIVGQTITLNEEPVTVIGVMPEGFRFMGAIDVWLNPKRVVPEVFSNFSGDYLTLRGMHYLNIVARLKPGVTLAQAQADIDTIVARLQKQYTSNVGHSAHLRSLYEWVVADVRPALVALMVAVGLVLLIACANVANLLLSRATVRQREIAIRTALGAGRVRIIRQLLTESVLLSLAGGILGAALAYWGVDALLAAAREFLPRASDVRVDPVVLGFALGVSVLSGLVFGLAPAFEASRASLGETLKEGGRSGSVGRSRNRLRSAMVVAEVALSLVLLAGAGLLLRSMAHILEVKPGFQPQNLMTMWVSFASSKYSQRGRSTQFVEQLTKRLEVLPGVQGVALTNDLPLEGQDTSSYPRLHGQSEEEEHVLVGMHVVNPAYFRAMGIPMLKGREFDDHDAANASPVVIVNESTAKRLWPGEDPIGKRVGLFGDSKAPPSEVVGVVGDVKHNGLDAPPSLDAYAPIAQNPWAYLCIVLRTTGDSSSLVAAVRKEVSALDPDQPVFGVRTMDQVMGETLARRRATLLLVGIFAALALILAAVGIYGVMAFVVSQRTQEIGIRVALGAQRQDILKLVVRQGMTLVLVGAVLGVAGSLAVTRFLQSLLFNVKPSDPLTFLAVTLLLSGIALAACWVPARRATKVDPMVALRYE